MQDPCIDDQKQEVLQRDRKTKQGQGSNEGNISGLHSRDQQTAFTGSAELKAWDVSKSKRREEKEGKKEQLWNSCGHSWPHRDQT